MRTLSVILLGLVGGCASNTSAPTQASAVPAAHAPTGPGAAMAPMPAAGVTDSELVVLLSDHWDWKMSTHPVWATTLGDRRFDGELERSTRADIAIARAAVRRFHKRASGIERDRLSRADAITLDLFRESLGRSMAVEVCEMETWSLSARGNAATAFNMLPEDHTIQSIGDAEQLAARYRQIPRTIAESVAHLKRGLAAGRVANRASVALVIDMLRKQLAKPSAAWALSKVDGRFPKSVKPGDRIRIIAELRRIVDVDIRRAVEGYVAFVEDTLLPAARGPQHVGLSHIQDGARCYAGRIQYYLGVERSPGELHRLGLEEIARINDEMRDLGERLFGTRELGDIVARLRTDPTLYFESASAVMNKARSASAGARAKISEYFGILPNADLRVVEIPEYEAPYTTIAYYRGPHADGSKPGEYFVNTYKPTTRPRFEAEVLAYHEGIPGHHLQISIAQERTELPAFRRTMGITAFVEGWALYTERLADEMGLYTGDLDRMGMLSYDAWRASRLVVDTGIHAMGWSRERAENYLAKHTALAENNIKNEVDRYITWPAQALAYKVGQRAILMLRGRAKQALGEKFTMGAFHDVVLRNGAVSLSVLENEVNQWIASSSQ